MHVDLHADGSIDRRAIATDRPTTIVVHRPRVYASAIEWTSYLRGSILLLPRIGPQHPWAAIVGWLRCLQQRGDHGALIVGHREASEPEDFAELRARALRHFLRDEQQAWVELATAHGRVQDTQVFLDYLHSVSAWDTGLPTITDTADAATARAVEAFQRTYNLAFQADIHEDGVIGEQTLGAIFEVAKTELVHWLELNQTSLDALNYYLSAEQLSADPVFDGRPWVQLLAIPFCDRYDLAREPDGAGLYPIAHLLPLPLVEIEAPLYHVLQIRLLDEWGAPLVRQAYELSVAGDTRFGETDEHGRLAEPFLPPGAVTLRLGEGAPVLFHDLYQPRQAFALVADDDDDDDIVDREAEFDAYNAEDIEPEDDEPDELDEDDDIWDALADEDEHAQG